MVSGVVRARAAILATLQSTTSSSGPWVRRGSPAIWSPLGSIDPTANGRMGCPSYHGRGGRCWYGMPLVRTHWHLLTLISPPERLERLPRKQKRAKYAHLEESHYFIPVAVETLGVFGPEAGSFLRELGRRITDSTLEPLSHHFLRQRIAVAIQRGNTAAILGSAGATSVSVSLYCFFVCFFVS